MKKLLAVSLALLFLLCFAACAKKAEVGSRLGSNLARVYTPADRTSRFFIDGEAIEGSAIGKAYLTPSADGKTTLAWVDTVVYFVSEKGVDRLGTGLSTAEISYDGGSALYLDGDKLMRYSLETRGSETLEEGVSSVVQFAFSASGETVMYTLCYSAAPNVYRTRMLRNGEVTDALELPRAIVLAVSDDASVIYYYNAADASFCVITNGETKVVSKECGAATNYNFTSDLSEVIFSTADDREIFYRLSDGLTKEIGTGFGYSLKTGVYSISTISLFTYLNDTRSFTNGLFMFRSGEKGSYLYSIGLLGKSGDMRMLAENALEYEAAADGSRVVWLGVGGLFSTDMNAETKAISDGALDFALSEDGRTVYYVSAAGTLFRAVGNKQPEKLESNVDSVCVFKGYVIFLKDKAEGRGTLGILGGSVPEQIKEVVRFDKRAGHLLVYSEPARSGDKEVYTLWLSRDGETFEKAAEGVDP